MTAIVIDNNPRAVRADLHNYGNIAFYNPWLNAQGYREETLLKDIVDSCIKNRVGITAVTSCQHEIPRGSVHDRLGLLQSKGQSLPDGYEFDKIGDNVIRVAHEGNEVYLLNGQAVIVNENGRRIHHIVVGSNQIPNGMNLQDTFDFCSDKNFLQLAVNPCCQAKYGMGTELFEQHSGNYDAVLGHTGEICVPKILTKIPKVGPIVAPVSRHLNSDAKYLAHISGIPSIAASSARWYNDFGTGAIEFSENLIDFSSEDSILAGLAGVIHSGNYSNIENYSSLTNLVKTKLISDRGKRLGWQ